MGLLNYTTEIDADKTAQEIAKILSMHGARAVLTEYNQEEGMIEAISFRISLNGNDIAFRLPCDWRPVYAILTKGKKNPFFEEQRKARWENNHRAQAVRTSWRIVKDWVEAQMALVETQMAKTEQVFLPYAIMKDGKTLSERVLSSNFLLEGK